jgi:hypothetical protein
MVTHFRNLLILKIEPALKGSIDLTSDQIERLQPVLDHFSEQDLLAMLDRAGAHYDRIHRSTQPRILLEAAMVEFCRWEKRIELADLVQQLQRLQAGVPGSAPASAPAGDGARGMSEDDGPVRSATGSTRRSGPSRTSDDSLMPAAGQAAAGTVDGWTELIQAVNQRNPGLAACLLDGLPAVRIEESILTVAYPPENAFLLRQVENGRSELEPRIAACFGRPLKLELTMVESGAGPSTAQREAIRREVAPTDRELLARQCADDPELGRLVDMVQGVPLPESERESWRRPDETAQPDETQPD